MAETPQEATSWLIKVATYIIGVLLGLAAKMAIKHKEKTLTWKEALVDALIAGAAAWFVWWLLSYYKKEDFAIICAVIVGRYGDAILKAAWLASSNFFSNLFKKDM